MSYRARKSPAFNLVLAATFGCYGALVGPATAADDKMVGLVAASTAPDVRPGLEIAHGEKVDIPEGSTVSVIDPMTMQLRSFEGPFTFEVAGIENGAGDPSMMENAQSTVAALSNLMAYDQMDMRPGAVRGTEDTACDEFKDGSLTDVNEALDSRCAAEAMDILKATRAQAPLTLYMTSNMGRDGAPKKGDVIEVQAFASDDAAVLCATDDGNKSAKLPLEGVYDASYANPLVAPGMEEKALKAPKKGRAISISCLAARGEAAEILRASLSEDLMSLAERLEASHADDVDMDKFTLGEAS